MKHAVAAIALVASCSSAMARDIVFEAGNIEACLVRSDSDEPVDMRDCPGQEANRCMELSPYGSSTMGMVTCLDHELQWWDARLNQTYKRVMAQSRAYDSERMEGTPSQADALKSAQRAWIRFRDETCAFERAQWGAGTGRGPAGVACLMHETAKRTLSLGWYLDD